MSKPSSFLPSAHEQIASILGDPRWQSVVARDRAADGSFFYSVASTGIYCRPSCPSRLARPEHVRFHASSEEAEQAGFRACKRCRPETISQEQRYAELVAQACRAIDTTDHFLPLKELAEQAGMSQFHFHRLFRRIIGITPHAYAKASRAERVRDSLQQGESVTKAIFDAGYGASSRFYADSNQALGMTATAYKRAGDRMTIRFAIGECMLGSILVALSERGICAILLGCDPAQLLEDLQERFRQAELIGADAEFDMLVAQVVSFVEQPGLGLALPLDVRGTVFQRRVWQTLNCIPVGQTMTYTEIAACIGMPKAVRAVASACAANPLAVAIPCHRVVRSDGNLAGYRWGLERKQALLILESSHTHDLEQQERDKR